MLRVSLVCLSVVCVVLSAPPPPPPAEQQQKYVDPMSLPADQLVEMNAKQLNQMEMGERALAMELTRQGIATADMAKKVSELSKQLDEVTRKGDSRLRRDAPFDNVDSKAESLKPINPKEVEKTERDLVKATDRVEKLDNKIDTMTEHMKKADMSVKQATQHSDTMKERTLQLDNQVDSLKKQSEELRTVSDELRKAVAKDSRTRRDTTLKAVDQLSSSLAEKIDSVASKADEMKQNVDEVKKTVEKVSDKAESAAREIREDTAEASSLVKHMDEHKADTLSAVHDAERALMKTDKLATEHLERIQPQPLPPGRRIDEVAESTFDADIPVHEH